MFKNLSVLTLVITLCGNVLMAQTGTIAGKISSGGSPASVPNPNAKAILLANINMIEGIVYGDLSKYYVSVPEAVTGNLQTPQQTSQRKSNYRIDGSHQTI